MVVSSQGAINGSPPLLSPPSFYPAINVHLFELSVSSSLLSWLSPQRPSAARSPHRREERKEEGGSKSDGGVDGGDIFTLGVGPKRAGRTRKREMYVEGVRGHIAPHGNSVP